MTERYKLLAKVHNEVNTYPYANDSTVHGAPDFWQPIGSQGRGDCEDYVLEKRRRLLAAGVPSQDLRIGLVRHPNGEAHAVLVVHDDQTDWIADQTRPHLMTAPELKNLGYEGDRLQVPGQWSWEGWKL